VNRFTVSAGAREHNLRLSRAAPGGRAQEFGTEGFQLAAAVRVTDQELLLWLVKEEAA
jgi:hypothetical protein